MKRQTGILWILFWIAAAFILALYAVPHFPVVFSTRNILLALSIGLIFRMTVWGRQPAQEPNRMQSVETRRYRMFCNYGTAAVVVGLIWVAVSLQFIANTYWQAFGITLGPGGLLVAGGLVALGYGSFNLRILQIGYGDGE